MGKGRKYETTLCKEFNRNVDDAICYLVGYSGNSATGAADLVLSSKERHVHVEVKKRSTGSGKRTTVMEGSSGDDSGLQECQHIVDGTPAWGESWILVKFSHREPIVIRASKLLEPESNDFCSLSPRLTGSDNISMKNDESIRSAKAGDAGWKILRDRLVRN